MRSISCQNGGAAFIAVLSYCILCFLSLFNPHIAVCEGRQVSFTQYSHAAWRIEDGAFSSTPDVVVQASDGYLWLGTDNGLYRFDGIRFVPWVDPMTGQPYTSPVYSLLATEDGGLLVGGGNGLKRLLHGVMTRISSSPGRINDLMRDRTGTVWVARSRLRDPSGPLCKLSGDHLACIGQKEHLDCTGAAAVVADKSGKIWIQGTDEICTWLNGKSENFSIAELKSQRHLRGLTTLAWGDGALWVGLPPIGKHRGLQQFDHGVWKSPPIPDLDPTSLKVSQLLFDHDGSMWIGTNDQGLYHLAHGHVEHFGNADGLTSNSVLTLYQDREDSIWVVTAAGLDRFHTRKVLTFSKSAGLEEDRVTSVSASDNGPVVVASGSKLFFFRPEKQQASVSSISVPGHVTTSVLLTHNGDIWVGVDDSLKVYRRGRFRSVTRADGSPLGPVRSLCEDKSGSIWVLIAGSESAPYRIGSDDIPRRVANLNGIAHSIFEDPSDGIWVLSNKGSVAHVTSQGVSIAEYSTPELSANSLSVHQDGSLWLSKAKGLFMMNNGKWVSLDRDHGLPCQEVYASIVDNRRSLWLSASCGLIRLSDEEVSAWRKDPTHKVKYELFDAIDGAQTGPITFTPMLTKTSDGRLWFVKPDILQMVDPGRIQHNSLPPLIEIEALYADHKSYPVARSMRLLARTRDVQIDYTGLSFVAPQKVAFRYRLLGADNTWSDVTTRRQAFYMNLGPGTYTFQVQGSNNDGVWNETGASVTFVIPPTLIQTLWFRILIVAVLLLMLVIGIVARMHYLSEALRSQLSERMVERERIARELHDTLLQGFQGLILRFGTAASHIPNGEPSKAMMESALDRADEVLLEGRSRVRNLRAEDVTSSDLLATLGDLSDELAIGQVAAFDVTVVGNERELHPIVREEAYWIGREALSNAQSHASATAIRLSLDFGPKTFVMMCVDNGRGIEAGILEAGAREGHWGLSGMRERAAKIGGTVRITCDGEPGTHVTLRVPAAVAYRKSKGQSRFDRLKMLFR